MQVWIICVICTKPFAVRKSRMDKAKYCDYTCHQIGEGRKAGQIRAAQMRAQSKGKSYPKINGRHAHRSVAEKVLGRSLYRGETVHHLDENKQNYSEDNLQVLPSQGEHILLHITDMLEARREKHGY